jgi:hypothetical protein
MARQLGRTFTIGESVGQRPQSLRRPPTGRRNVKAPGTRVTYVAPLERGSDTVRPPRADGLSPGASPPPHMAPPRPCRQPHGTADRSAPIRIFSMIAGPSTGLARQPGRHPRSCCCELGQGPGVRGCRPARTARRLPPPVRMEPSEHGLRAGIGFLALHAPIFEFLERDRHAGDRAAHERAWPQHPKISIQIFDLGFGGRARVESIEHVSLRGEFQGMAGRKHGQGLQT